MSQTHFNLKGLDALTHNRVSVFKMFFVYALPLSLIPPGMIQYAGAKYAGQFLPVLAEKQLQTLGIIFFVAELLMTFLVAFVIQKMSLLIKVRPTYEDAYKLAVIVPMPLWFAPLFLFFPNFILNITVVALALIISSFLIIYNAPAFLAVQDEMHAILLSIAILGVGMVAWATMLYITLITWSWLASHPAASLI